MIKHQSLNNIEISRVVHIFFEELFCFINAIGYYLSNHVIHNKAWKSNRIVHILLSEHK